MRLATRCVHRPAVDAEGFRALAPATHRASTIVFPDAAAFEARHARGVDGYGYGRDGTPTTRELEAQIAALEGAEGAVLAPSGQSAAAVAMLTLLGPGDHLLLPEVVYPP